MATLSQVQIIRSLAEALAWFEKELEWAVEPAQLLHLTGRIGELYAAMITRGQMALAVNQKGYDVVSADGERISVKTVTTSKTVSFNKNTITEVDRIMVLRIVVDETEASIEEVLDCRKPEFAEHLKLGEAGYSFLVKKPGLVKRSIEDLKVVATVETAGRRVDQLENGTILVNIAGVRQPMAKPVLREICKELGIDLLNANGNKRNTRQLGAAIIAALGS